MCKVHWKRKAQTVGEYFFIRYNIALTFRGVALLRVIYFYLSFLNGIYTPIMYSYSSLICTFCMWQWREGYSYNTTIINKNRHWQHFLLFLMTYTIHSAIHSYTYCTVQSKQRAKFSASLDLHILNVSGSDIQIGFVLFLIKVEASEKVN